MVGTTVLYHPDAQDDAGEVAIIVGVNPPADPAAAGETVNLVVFPDVDAPPDDSPDASSAGSDFFGGWMPYRVTDVPRDQPGGDATTAYWSPIPA